MSSEISQQKFKSLTSNRKRPSILDTMSRVMSNSSGRNQSRSGNTWKRPHLRLCHLVKTHPDEAYGFTICATESDSMACHIVSRIKSNSPASRSGLCLRDRIIEVNGCNIENENASQIESRIRIGLKMKGPGQTLIQPQQINVDDCENNQFTYEDGSGIASSRPQALVESTSSNDSGLVIDSNCSTPVVANAPATSTVASTDDDSNSNNDITVNINECLLLVLDPKSYSLYYSDRSKFLSSAPVVFMKPVINVVDTDESGISNPKSCDNNNISENIPVELNEPIHPDDVDCEADGSSIRDIDEGLSELNEPKSESILLTSSNDSFEILESKIESVSEGIFQASEINDDSHHMKSISKSICDSGTENQRHCLSGDSTNTIERQPISNLMQLPFEDDFAPRLCYLRKQSRTYGFGFHLISPRNSKIQIISKVDKNSPASFAGLRDNDIVIEVNGVNVLNENHRQVVTRITEGVIRNGQRFRDEVVLLVVSSEAKEWYDQHGILINYRLPNILVMGSSRNGTRSVTQKLCDRDAPSACHPHGHSGDINHLQPIKNVIAPQTCIRATPPICKTSIEVKLAKTEDDHQETSSRSFQRNGIVESRKSPSDAVSALAKSALSHCVPVERGGAIQSSNLTDKSSQQCTSEFLSSNMTVAQMREMLRKRGGKRNIIDQCNRLTLSEKYQIVQNM